MKIKRDDTMHTYTMIYEFAASAGALEGYVYSRKEIDMKALSVWVDNLLAAYRHIPAEIRREFQSSCDQTLGRAIRSLIPLLGEGDEIISKLKLMVVAPLPGSPDDFEKKKWFQE
ncbi:MAG: hypothetical protein KKE57_02170 [Proteobacteria bacterium]|nr:hypothetical protein [Pseudomonadota bacterium]